MSGQIKHPTLLETLAVRLSAGIGDDVRARAALHLVDWLGCAVAGSVEPAGKIARRAKPDGMSGNAFFLGMLGNILEMDDVDKRAILHPGPAIVPAAVSLCIGRPDLLPRLLDGIVAGYEATIRLGRATGSEHYSKWHTTGTCGAIGAAAACARLLDLNATSTAHALALAMSQAAGLWQTRHEPQSMGKQLHTAHAARAGLDSARLAAEGFKGPLSILEGEQGFFAACAPGADPSDVLNSYEADWLIRQVSFKPWAACRHAHAAIDAALQLHRDGLDLAEIDEIRVRTYADALRFCDKPDPKSTIEAKFSLQHSVAIVLSKGRPKITDFDTPAIAQPDLIALRAKVRVATADPYASAYPARYGARVEVQMKNGVSVSVDAPDALGDPENPLAPEQVKQKAAALMAHAELDDARASRLIHSAEIVSPDLFDALQESLLA
jgi:2-methylcitrate dehydratase PrpD